MSTPSPLSPSLHPPPTATPTPRSIPPLVYRIHHPSSQTRYSFSTGFSAKNQTTILAFSPPLLRFGLAHLHQQTNISSPFISVYDDLAHAEHVARWMAAAWAEDVWIDSAAGG
ncbi:hypothetical protein IAQ61_009174 [Plenodomus lingam]|uniref:uncharacterized protein n=1 Tax=Leptosphaeria maculans TaxID=5022 RepID=UPI0033201179|nr:hypothetical protein IAQ61_009174 [Plenodomus lingam]